MGRDEEKSNNELSTETARKSFLLRRLLTVKEFLGKAKGWFKITDEDYQQLG